MSKRPIVLIGFIAFIVLLIVLYPRADHPTPAAPHEAASKASSEKPIAERSNRPPRHPAASVAAPDDGKPFDEARAALEQRALAGDAAAARRLGITLSSCNGYKPTSPSELQDSVVNMLAAGVRFRTGGQEWEPNEVLALFRFSDALQRRDCKDAGALVEDDAESKAFEWLERAAALGDIEARARYGALAFRTFDSRSALARAETLRERRGLAENYLKSALDNGSSRALFEYSQHYDVGLLFPPDDDARYAYLYAYSLTAEGRSFEPEIMDGLLRIRAEGLDETRLARARATGERLSQCCGAGQ